MLLHVGKRMFLAYKEGRQGIPFLSFEEAGLYAVGQFIYKGRERLYK